MCLIAFAIGVSPRWPLVIASNRDEFLNRPTLPLYWWTSASGQEILSGQDVRAGGTWLGATRSGRVAFLTNVREPAPQVAAFSRGDLVKRWLESRSDADAFAATIRKESGSYGAFNLVLGDLQQQAWVWVSNRSSATGSSWQTQALAKDRIYTLSNASLDTPWPKSVALKGTLGAALKHTSLAELMDGTADHSIWRALADRSPALLQALPRTGASEAMELGLSSVFVDLPAHGYRTRSSTLLVASRSQTSTSGLKIDMVEKTHLSLEKESFLSSFAFEVESLP